MKLLRLIALGFAVAVLPVAQVVYAGGAKSGSVFPRNLSVEELARMVYEAAKNDPTNAAVIFMDALASRDSWTAAELNFVIDALMIAVPDMPASELTSLIVGDNIPKNVAQQVVDRLESDLYSPENPVIEAKPVDVPIYPVVPTPDSVSGVK